MRAVIDGARAWLSEPVDAASLAVLRIAFGAVMLVATLRFAAMGWIDELYVAPSFHFTYWGFDWVRPWPAWGLYLHFALLAIACTAVMLGALYRVAIAAFVVLFGYVELLDATTYLNHYYAITLVGVLLCFAPAADAWSIDAWWRGAHARMVPRWAPLALRVQLGLVYFFAGVAKLQPDWLVHGEPLRTWLAARTDFPVLGPLFDLPQTALAMSWAGALFDLSVPFLLTARRTRPLAYAAVIAFHALTGALFRIGMFPMVMVALTPIFFEHDWPRRLWPRIAARTPWAEVAPRMLTPAALGALACWLVVQLALPVRHHAYPGDVLWTEEGMRWAWHVMVVERAGVAEFRVVDADGREHVVDPGDTLTPLQERMMATQPDLVLQFAHHLRDQHAREGRHVRVYADVWVSVNGRRSRQLVNPRVDLASIEDGLAPYDWVLR